MNALKTRLEIIRDYIRGYGIDEELARECLGEALLRFRGLPTEDQVTRLRDAMTTGRKYVTEVRPEDRARRAGRR